MKDIQFKRELLSVLGRIAGSLEAASDYEIPEMQLDQIKVAYCPHCEILNPTITKLDDDEKTGPLGHFLLKARCHSCKEVFWAVPDWSVFTTSHEASTALKDKAEIYESSSN